MWAIVVTAKAGTAASLRIVEAAPAALIQPGAPFAVGLVVRSTDTFVERSGGTPGRAVQPWLRVPERGRLAVALAAYRAGRYLMDVVQADTRTGVSDHDLALLWHVAARVDAQAVYVHGMSLADAARLEPMADELRLVVCLIRPDPP